MRFKLVSIMEEQTNTLLKPLLNVKAKGLNNYVMRYAYKPEKMSKIQDFWKLKDVIKNGEPYRWMHTEHMLQSFYVLRGSFAEATSEESYKIFIEGRNKRGEEYISFKNFLSLRELTKEITSNEFDSKFLAYLIATHDIGCIKGEARHFIRSGEMSVSIFKELGYNEAHVEMARLINGNHTLIGEILLGEGTPEYAISIYNKLASLSLEMGEPSDYGWHLLFILTAIDIHSAYRGFLTNKKYEDLCKTRDLKEIESKNENWINERKVLLGFPDAEFVPEFQNLYMQYVDGRLKQLKQEDSASAVWLLNKLSQLFEYLRNTRIKDRETHKYVPLDFFCITFKSGNGHDGNVMSHITKSEGIITLNLDKIPHSNEDGIVILLEGTFCGLPFCVTSDGYIEIDDVSEVK